LKSNSNSVGGILCLWSEETFKLDKKLIGCGFIYQKKYGLLIVEKVIIVNLYSPCDATLKRNLWE